MLAGIDEEMRRGRRSRYQSTRRDGEMRRGRRAAYKGN